MELKPFFYTTFFKIYLNFSFILGLITYPLIRFLIYQKHLNSL